MWYLCTSILGILWRCSFVLFVVFADLQAQYNGGILIFQSAFVFVLLIADERLKLPFLLGIYNSKLENSQEKYIANNYWTPLCDTLWLYLCFLVHRSVQGEAYTNIEGVFRSIRCSFQAQRPCGTNPGNDGRVASLVGFPFIFVSIKSDSTRRRKLDKSVLEIRRMGKMGIKQNQTKSNLTQVSRLEKNE